MDHFGCHGPNLQAAMFASGVLPEPAAIEAACDRARQAFLHP